jgi:hypothetical protein
MKIKDRYYLLANEYLKPGKPRTYTPRSEEIENCPFYGTHKRDIGKVCMLPSGVVCGKSAGITCAKDITRAPYTGWRKKKPTRKKVKRCKCT